jgi:hypothetical protein
MRTYNNILVDQLTHYQHYHHMIIAHYNNDFTSENPQTYLCSEEFIDFHPYLPTISIDGDVSFPYQDKNMNDFSYKIGFINPQDGFKTSYKIAYFNHTFYLFSMRLFTFDTKCEGGEIKVEKCFSYDTFIPINIRLSMVDQAKIGVGNFFGKFSSTGSKSQEVKSSVSKTPKSWWGGRSGGTKRHKMKRRSKHKRHSNPIRRTPKPLRRNKSTQKRKYYIPFRTK